MLIRKLPISTPSFASSRFSFSPRQLYFSHADTGSWIFCPTDWIWNFLCCAEYSIGFRVTHLISPFVHAFYNDDGLFPADVRETTNPIMLVLWSFPSDVIPPSSAPLFPVSRVHYFRIRLCFTFLLYYVMFLSLFVFLSLFLRLTFSKARTRTGIYFILFSELIYINLYCVHFRLLKPPRVV